MIINRQTASPNDVFTVVYWETPSSDYSSKQQTTIHTTERLQLAFRRSVSTSQIGLKSTQTTFTTSAVQGQTLELPSTWIQCWLLAINGHTLVQARAILCSSLKRIQGALNMSAPPRGNSLLHSLFTPQVKSLPLAPGSFIWIRENFQVM